MNLFQAFNRAGLFTVASSWAFVVDVSPPVIGHVYDGPFINGMFIDLDNTNDHTKIAAHWKGFHDPHTSIKEYFIAVGSCSDCDDVLVEQTIGLQTGSWYWVTFLTKDN